MTHNQERKLAKLTRMAREFKYELADGQVAFIDSPLRAERLRNMVDVVRGVHGLLLNERSVRDEG